MDDDRERQQKWLECVNQYRDGVKELWNQFLANQKAYADPIAYIACWIPTHVHRGQGPQIKVEAFATLEEAQRREAFVAESYADDVVTLVTPIFHPEQAPPLPPLPPLPPDDNEIPF